MKDYTVRLTNDELRSLCINNEWFEGGTSEQYNKLFQMNDEGVTLETLATIIWTCSDGFELAEIHEALHAAAAWPIYTTAVSAALRREGFGETERAIILEALRTHPDAGTCFRVIEG